MPYHDWSVKLSKIGNRIFDFAPYRGMLGDTPLAKFAHKNAGVLPYKSD